MKSLKIIGSFTFITATLLLLEGCSMDRNLSSGILCDDRFCIMNSKIEIDQTDVDRNEVDLLPSVSGQKMMQSKAGDVNAMGLIDGLLSLTPTMTLVGTIDPPLVNGTQVQASDITINGSKVYVAYNTRGETQSGAIDVVDISSPTAASLVSQALYPTMDIHKVTVNSGKLYAAGANANGSVLQRVTLDSSGKLTSTVESVALRGTGGDGVPAYAGVSVAVSGTNVYAVSDTNGGLSVLSTSNLQQTRYIDIPDARDVSVNSSNVYVVTGRTNSAQALLKKYNSSTFAAGTDLSLSGAVANDEGKSTVLTGTNMQVVTAGEGGTRVVCLSTGAVLATTTNPIATTLTSAERAANAATFGAGYMFVANGEAGVAVYSLNVPLINFGACALNSVTFLGRFTLGTDASANNVSYSNGYLIVATGTKGFKIVKVTTSLLSGLLQAQ